MMIARLMACSALAAGVVFAAGSASATLLPGLDIDFRNPIFDPGANSGTVTTAVSPFGDITVSDTKLFWATDDGFGIYGGEDDEIDGSETLFVTMDSGPIEITAIGFTDLFLPQDGGPGGEEAMFTFFLGGVNQGSFTVTGDDPLGTNNGEFLFNLTTAIEADRIEFFSSGEINDDYSVAGLNAQLPGPGPGPGPSPAPEPATLGLLGAGLLALSAAARRRRRT